MKEYTTQISKSGGWNGRGGKHKFKYKVHLATQWWWEMHICGKIYKKNQNKLKKHIENHNNTNANKELVCVICNQQCNNESNLETHLNKDHDDVSHNQIESEYKIHMYSEHKDPSIEEIITESIDDHDDGEFTCSGCSYQTNNLVILKKHTKETNHLESENHNMIIQSTHNYNCNLCRFKTRGHRTYKPCAKYALSKCEFYCNCMYNHTLLNDNEHICYNCGYRTKIKRYLMNHIKETHGCLICRKLDNKYCNRAKCWFRHDISNPPNTNVSRLSVSPSPLSPLDFPHLPYQGEPPDQNKMVLDMLKMLCMQMNQYYKICKKKLAILLQCNSKIQK